MALGPRLRQARLDAGLSQRQLCGDMITRNMLSQIENGSAQPSMETLRYLAAQLEKPVSFFLEEDAITSPNQQRLAQARHAFQENTPRKALELLRDWQEPDPVFDPERWLLEAFSCLRLAEQVLADGKPGYARDLLEQAAKAEAKTLYVLPELRRTRLLLTYRVRPEDAVQLAAQLPQLLPELLLRGQAALSQGDAAACGKILDAVPSDDPAWQYLRAEAYYLQQDYSAAVSHYRKAEDVFPKKAIQRLESCYEKLEDYKMAYQYACRLRQL